MQSGIVRQHLVMLKAFVLLVASVFGLLGFAAENACVCSPAAHTPYCVYHLSQTAAPILTAQPGVSCCSGTQAHTCHVRNGHPTSAADLTLAIGVNTPRASGQLLTLESSAGVDLYVTSPVFLPPIVAATARSALLYLHYKILLC